MKRVGRIVLFALLLTALPLRGYAGVLTALCESHHGGVPVVEEHAHEHGDDHPHDGDGSISTSHVAAVCSLCASCCAGAVLAPGLSSDVGYQRADTLRIPFLARQVSGHVPEHRDRPPLSL